MSAKGLTLFENTQIQLDAAASLLNLEPNIHAVLREPMQELHVSIPVRMDNGKVMVFKGFRIQHNRLLILLELYRLG